MIAFMCGTTVESLRSTTKKAGSIRMTRDDIANMWEKANGWSVEGWPNTVDELERFAALVAAAEREAIARMIEDSPPMVSFAQNEMGGCVMCGFTPKLAALTIRERGAP
jgi:hypothetical protein